MTHETVSCDAVVFGGSASGLWVLHNLKRAGYRALLIEADHLGGGQTVACQGIIHGGLKYTLHGKLNASARAIRDMPCVWRQCLAGQQYPPLARDVLRADYCHLWRSNSVRGHIGLIGARHGLQVKPLSIPRDTWPKALDKVQGEVFRLDEPVISPLRFIRALTEPVSDSLINAGPDSVHFEYDTNGVKSVVLTPDESVVPAAAPLVIHPSVVILTAGIGNAALRQQLGLDPTMMQTRSVHMLIARGELPCVNGHCVEGTGTKVTITTDRDTKGRAIWQIGGRLSEEAVAMNSAELIDRGRKEVEDALGGRPMAGVEWATYRADKAEVVTPGGKRPDDAFVHRERNVITAWPTKLALVPRLAQRVSELARPLWEEMPSPAPFDWRAAGWPAPRVALPPWEKPIPWTHYQ